MNIETKFKIGDFVYLRAQVKHFKEVVEPLSSKKDYTTMGDLETGLRKPMAFQIIERVIQTCPDGTQVHYRVRSLTTHALLQYLEQELSADFSY